VSPGESVLAAALAAGIPLPHSCRAGYCATCKAKLLAGEIAYPNDRLPPGILASEAARGEVLLCQARPRSDLSVLTPARGAAASARVAVTVEVIERLTTGGRRVTLRMIGAASLAARPGQYIDIEAADDARERVPVVAVAPGTLDVEMLELEPMSVVRIAGPFDSPR
jgi:CDP-4-dehydro-6-deoxyglucose reductase